MKTKFIALGDSKEVLFEYEPSVSFEYEHSELTKQPNAFALGKALLKEFFWTRKIGYSIRKASLSYNLFTIFM